MVSYSTASFTEDIGRENINSTDPGQDAGFMNQTQFEIASLSEKRYLASMQRDTSCEIFDCIECGKRIPKARREALPGVATCVKCAE